MKRIGIIGLCFALTVACICALSGCAQNSYTPEKKTPQVSSSALGQADTLRVGVNTDNAPLAGKTASSKIIGIDVDMAAALADEMGLKLEIVDVGSNGASALAQGTVDIVMGVDESNTDASMWKSEAYLQTASSLFAASSSDPVPTATSQDKIAAQVSSSCSWAATNEFGSERVKIVNDLSTAFNEMDSGSVKYVAADSVIGRYAAYTSGIEANVIALIQPLSGYCVGVNSTNTELKSVVEKTLKSLSDGGITSLIEIKWLGSQIDYSSIPLTDGAKGKIQKVAATSQENTENADNEVAANSEDVDSSEGIEVPDESESIENDNTDSSEYEE